MTHIKMRGVVGGFVGADYPGRRQRGRFGEVGRSANATVRYVMCRCGTIKTQMRNGEIATPKHLS